MGHAAPFDFTDAWRPADGMARALCGTPAILAMAALEEGIATFGGVAMSDVCTKSRGLGDLFLALVDENCTEYGIGIACPRESAACGSQISLRHPEGYAIIQALISESVIGDFRAPDILRFGFAPLYTRYVDVWDAVERLVSVMRQETWRMPRFHLRAAVT
jgi:kynureninase